MTELSNDELFRLLSSSRRRYIIYLLYKEGGSMSLNDLATRIAAEENDKPVAEVTDSERQRVYISLYQTHLPKLEDADVVEYDEDERVVSPTSEIIDEGFFFTDLPEPRPWYQYYAALGVVGWLGVAAALAGLVAWPLVAGVVTFGVTLLSAYQYYEGSDASPQDEAIERLVD
jgi:hypothetical protein